MKARIKTLAKRILKVHPALYARVQKIWGSFQLAKQNRKKRNAHSHMYRVDELFMQQNTLEGYGRLDTIVRLLAIENEYEKNDFGWELYRKMQEKRCGANSDLSVDERVENFRRLIVSWGREGYNTSSQIELDNNLRLTDGSHRMAMAIYHGLEEINCKVTPVEDNVYYGLRWFIENDFSIEEMNKILSRADDVCTENEVMISCLLWPPVAEYFDEIVKKLSLVYDIRSIRDMEFSEETFSRFVQAVYKIDDIEQWKIDKKIEYMAQYTPKCVRLVMLAFQKPQFRQKDLNHNTLLIQGEELKRMVRSCYKDKIEHYFYDIICHTGDNAEQSEYIRRLCEPKLSLMDYFAKISQMEWMIVKLESPYLTRDFPQSFPFSKDIDIVCSKNDFEQLVMVSQKYFAEAAEGYYDELKIIRKHLDRCLIRVELKGCLVFMVDVFCTMDGLDECFLFDSLSRRVRMGNYYVPQEKDELCYRIYEYIQYPEKKQHLQYVFNHRQLLDRELVKQTVSGAECVLEEIFKANNDELLN